MSAYYKCFLHCVDFTTVWRLLAGVQWSAMLISGDNGTVKGALSGKGGTVTHRSTLPLLPAHLFSVSPGAELPARQGCSTGPIHGLKLPSKRDDAVVVSLQQQHSTPHLTMHHPHHHTSNHAPPSPHTTHTVPSWTHLRDHHLTLARGPEAVQRLKPTRKVMC